MAGMKRVLMKLGFVKRIIKKNKALTDEDFTVLSDKLDDIMTYVFATHPETYEQKNDNGNV